MSSLNGKLAQCKLELKTDFTPLQLPYAKDETNLTIEQREKINHDLKVKLDTKVKCL